MEYRAETTLLLGLMSILTTPGCSPPIDHDLPSSLRAGDIPSANTAVVTNDDSPTVNEPDEGSLPALVELSWEDIDINESGQAELEALPALVIKNLHTEQLNYRQRIYVSLAPTRAWSSESSLEAGEEAHVEPSATLQEALSDHPGFPALVRASVQTSTTGGPTQTLMTEELFVKGNGPYIFMTRDYYEENEIESLTYPGATEHNSDTQRVVSAAPASAKLIDAQLYEEALAESQAYNNENSE